MPFFDHNSGNMTLSIKILLMSTTVLSAAIILKLSAPAITDFAVSDVPSLWNGIVAWLKPPYLYLVINGIIITIVASSKLQSKSDGDVSPSPHLPHEAYVQVQPAAVFQTKQAYDNVVLSSATVAELAKPTPPSRTEVLSSGDYKSVEFGAYGQVDARVSETEEAFTVKAAAVEDEVEMKISNEFVISKSTWTTPVTNTMPVSNTPPEYSSNSAEKPPPSSRFGHRRKASIEGGKGALGVSKPRKQDTLESTWKTMTEGRAMPLTRHLRKSDTWEMHGRRGHQQEATPPQQKMKKSETFNDRSETSSSLSPSPGASKLRKEPSLSQDELNRRVEAFIKKFNEEMRLQRQESLNQYMEMINRGV